MKEINLSVKLFLTLLVLISLNSLSCRDLFAAEDKALLCLFGDYDTRLGDLWSASFYTESGNKGHWFGGGYGGSLFKNAASDVDKKMDEDFNSRYGGNANGGSDSKVKSYNLFYAYFPDPVSMPWYIGASYSVISWEDKVSVINHLDGMSATGKGEWSSSSFDIILGFAMLKKSSFFFDLRLGYGFVSETPLKTRVKVKDTSGATYEGTTESKLDPFMDNVFMSASLGYSF